VADGGLPVSCLLSSASLHNSQAAIPLEEMTQERVTHCDGLMDGCRLWRALDQTAQQITGACPPDRRQPRSKVRKAELEEEQKGRREANYKTAESIRYNKRSTVERVNGRLKDEFGGRMIRVKGHAKMMAHLMFGIIALTVD